MMRPLAFLFTVALVAGCGRGAPVSADQQSCESQANADPVVKAMIIKGAGNPHYQVEGQDELRAAKQDALVACLRNRGIVSPGGVERQKPL